MIESFAILIKLADLINIQANAGFRLGLFV